MDCNLCGRTNIDRLLLCPGCGAFDHMARRILDLEDAYTKKHTENGVLRGQVKAVTTERDTLQAEVAKAEEE